MKKIIVSDALKSAKKNFIDAKIDTPGLDAEVLLAEVLHADRLSLYVHPEKILSDEEFSRFKNFVERRAKKIPVAYITGKKEFFGMNFFVTPEVLIPRPDTEILVQFVIDVLKNFSGGVKIADMGTGSGAICISILKNLPNATAATVDISPGAIEVAKRNAENLQVADRINFFPGNMFEPLSGKKFDCIVSNPPYIPTDEIKNLQPEVKTEPKIALDGGADGLNFYRQLVKAAPDFLSPNGFFAFEIGIGQAEEVKKIIRRDEKFCEIKILKDLSGIDRVVTARKK